MLFRTGRGLIIWVSFCCYFGGTCQNVNLKFWGAFNVLMKFIIVRAITHQINILNSSVGYFVMMVGLEKGSGPKSPETWPFQRCEPREGLAF